MTFVLGPMALRIPPEQFGQLRLGPIIGIGSANFVCRVTVPTGQSYALRLTTLNLRLNLAEDEPEQWNLDRLGDFSEAFLEESKWATLAAAMGFGVPVHEVFYLQGQLQLANGRQVLTRCGAILMDLFDGTLQRVLGGLTALDRRQLAEITGRMLATGFLSDDMHNKNVLYKDLPDGSRLWRFIDFERMKPLADWQETARQKGQNLLQYYLQFVLGD